MNSKIILNDSYETQVDWRKRNELLPEEFQITKTLAPVEYFIHWRNNKIHIDHYHIAKPKAKIIMLHGVGGNGRLLSFAAIPLVKLGYEIIAPDLPGYGLSVVDKKSVTYHDWIELAGYLIDQVKANDSLPLFIFGLSAGGMLAYQAAALNPKVNGVIATNLLDQRMVKVRDYSSGNLVVSRMGVPLLGLLSKLNIGLMLPMKAVANMKAIVNNKEMCSLLLKDKTASGTKVPVRFISTLLNVSPAVEPEEFMLPLLLVHPEFDEWTPVKVSQLFFNRLQCKKELKILEGAGHFPIEKPGIQQLPIYVNQFIENHKTTLYY